MCGIIGVVGSSDTLATLLEGLQRLEYRGYDSAGVALVRQGQTWRARTAAGTESVAALREECEHAPNGFSSGIGHTRWATHGAPEAINAHPHLDCSGNIAIIHNGIIENHTEIQEQLEARGHLFTSVTDSEVLAHLIEEHRHAGLELMEAVRQSLLTVRGTAPGVTYLASDVPAILDRATAFYAVNDDEIVRLGPEGFRAIDLEGAPVRLRQLQIDWDLETAEKGGHDDFMSKEINEQPEAIRSTLLDRRRRDGQIAFDELRISDQELRDVKRVVLVAAGTSHHAALVAKYAIERWSSGSLRVARPSTRSRRLARPNAEARVSSRCPTSLTRRSREKPTRSSIPERGSKYRLLPPRPSSPRSPRSNCSHFDWRNFETLFPPLISTPCSSGSMPLAVKWQRPFHGAHTSKRSRRSSLVRTTSSSSGATLATRPRWRALSS